MIVRYMGGLGNQIFQYAFGMAIQRKYGCKLKFDISSYNRDKKRIFELRNFNISSSPQLGFITAMLYELLLVLARRDLLSFIPWKELFFEFERKPFARQEVPQQSLRKYFVGSWQVVDYFDAIRDELKKELFFKEMSDEALVLYNQIVAETNTVAVHVRRGDYLSEAQYVVQDFDYYKKAIAIIREWDNNAVFYVFSDDMEWCKKEFCGIDAQIKYVEGFNSVDDFMFMRACKNHIISNSTFSWWPAYLTDGGIKLAPIEWFVRNESNERVKISLLKGFKCI